MSRKIDESIMVGENVEIKVVAVSGKKVKLGITPPKNIKVHRKEIFRKFKKSGIRISRLK